MNKTEIKGILKDIVAVTTDSIKQLTSKKEWLLTAIQKIEQLDEHLSEYVEEAFEQDELIQSVTNEFFTSELEELYEMTTDLWNDITSYADELSELKRERILEKYENLEHVSEMFSQAHSEYDDVDNAIEHLEEAIHMLKDMY